MYLAVTHDTLEFVSRPQVKIFIFIRHLITQHSTKLLQPDPCHLLRITSDLAQTVADNALYLFTVYIKRP